MQRNKNPAQFMSIINGFGCKFISEHGKDLYISSWYFADISQIQKHSMACFSQVDSRLAFSPVDFFTIWWIGLGEGGCFGSRVSKWQGKNDYQQQTFSRFFYGDFSSFSKLLNVAQKFVWKKRFQQIINVVGISKVYGVFSKNCSPQKNDWWWMILWVFLDP